MTQFVNSTDMVAAGGPTVAARVIGLDVESMRFGAHGDLMRATLSADSCEVRITDHGRAATSALGGRPTETVYLTSDLLAASAGPASVTDTSLWAASGVFHCGTEAIAYTGKTATTFTGLSRGAIGSIAQGHLVANGAGLAYPRVTNVPEGLEGRRVTIYFYGDGDDPQGPGTLVHRGLAATGAKFSRGVWTFSVDPMTRMLDAEIGAGFNTEPVPIRGIYYPVTAPLLLVFQNIGFGTAVVRMTGFYADQNAFCAQLTTLIAAAIATPRLGTWPWSAGSQITAQAWTGGWDVLYFVGTGAGTPARVGIGQYWVSDVDGLSPVTHPHFWQDDGAGPGALLDPGTVPTAGLTYRARVISQVPRAAVGRFRGRLPWPAPSPFDGMPVSDPTADESRVYLGGLVIPTIDMTATLTSDSGADSAIDTPLYTTSVDAANRTMLCSCSFRVLGPRTRVQFGTLLAQGTIDDLRLALVSVSPDASGLGKMPLVTSTDILPLDATAPVDAPLGRDRIFDARPGIKLGEIVENELRALGCYQRLNAGAIEWVRIRGSTSTDTVAWVIGEADLHRGTWPGFERGADGIVSSVVYKSGYDPAENKWNGRTITIRDVESASASPNRASISIEIAQRSYPRSRLEGRPVDNVPFFSVVQLAAPILSIFGAEYDRLTVAVGMRYFGVKIGDTVSLTSSKVPAVDGTLGVVGAICLVTGHSFDASTRRISLELLRSGQAIAGYAPGFRVTSQSNIAGNVWDITVNLSDYTGATDIATWLTINDSVRVTQGDAATPTEVVGTVTAFTGVNTPRIDFGASAWTPGGEWCLRTRDAAAYNANAGLGRFFFMAGTNAKISFADVATTARVLAA